MWPAPRFLEWLDSRRHGNGQAHRHPNPRRRSALPRLEALEDRIVLSPSFLVSNLADSGDGSLRQAILDANARPGADVINFAHNLHGTITLTMTRGQLLITDSLTINGLGANRLTISGSGASRVFAVSSAAIVTIKDLEVADGSAATGGGIDNAGRLTLTRIAVTDNQSVGGLGGGGILNEPVRHPDRRPRRLHRQPGQGQRHQRRSRRRPLEPREGQRLFLHVLEQPGPGRQGDRSQ